MKHTVQRLALILLLLTLAGCTELPFSLTPEAPPLAPPGPTSTPAPTAVPPPPIQVAEITFRVTIPGDTPSDGPIQLSILDEVTGLALNPVHYQMQAETQNIYTVTIQHKVGGVLKYRYTRGADILAAEHTSDGRPVRYRMLQVNASGAVHDIVTRWNDTKYAGPIGRITGKILDSRSGDPIPNLLISIGGQQTLTRWDGTYLVEGLPPGTHTLVAYALDGSYNTFQQGAVIATQATTPAEFALEPAELTRVTFHATIPEGSIPAAPLRIAGNLHQLGNVFADLSGGISTPAARLPLMDYHADGFYLLTLELPVGTFVRYKYTMGDGFWNMETTPEGEVHLREFIVPADETVRNDEVLNWGSKSGLEPAWFSFQTPADTPPADTVWLQLNPWGWTEPLPAWRTGANDWVYLLSAPLHSVAEVQFRYCRNAQCEVASEEAPGGGRAFTPGTEFTVLEQDVSGWKGLPVYSGEPVLPHEDAAVKPAGYTAGYGLVADYHPSWLPLASEYFPAMRARGANTVMLSPTWSFTTLTPPVFQVVTGTDAPWLDIAELASAAGQAGLQTSMYPQPNFPETAETFWEQAPRDYAWWTNWFEQYGHFALHHAGLAQASGVGTLVLGGGWVSPALPDGLMPDGFTSGVPREAEAWWPDLLEEVREVYSGQVAWALPFPSGLQLPESFLHEVDIFYLLWEAPLAEDPDASVEDMIEAAGVWMDEELLPFFLRYNIPMVVVAGFPSAQGGASGGVSGGMDLQEQADAYQALLAAMDGREWINGVISAGYQPAVSTLDTTGSTNGKPAGITLESWFQGWFPPSE